MFLWSESNNTYTHAAPALPELCTCARVSRAASPALYVCVHILVYSPCVCIYKLYIYIILYI